MANGIGRAVAWLFCLMGFATTGTTAVADEASQAGAAPGPAGWYRGYLQGSRLIRLPTGRTLNLYCLGSGGPTVILEAGLGGGAFDWWPVQERMARTTRVCAYDRAGHGRSPVGPFPRDTRAQVADLEALLRAARIRGPYVLVGHSMGGFNMRVFASRHLREVAGMVLVDPSAENQISITHAAAPAIAANDERSLRRAWACADPQRSEEIARLCTRPAPDGFPPDLATAWASSFDLATAQTGLSEAEAFLNADSGQVAAERRHLGAMPLIILTRGERSSDIPADQAETEWRLWNGRHEELARLSSVGSNRVVQGANHYIQLDRPDAVVDAVREVLAQARRH